MTITRRPQRPFLLAATVLSGGALLILLGLAATFFLTHHHSAPASPASAEAELSQVRAHLAGRQTAGGRLHSFHTVIFDTRGGGRLVHIAVPYWFGRLFAGRSGEFRWLGELTFLDDTEFDGEPIHLTLDELRRRGPGVLADRRHATGGQLIAWVE